MPHRKPVQTERDPAAGDPSRPLPAAAIEFDPGCKAKPPVQSVDAALSVRLEHRPVLIGRSGIVTERRL
jgi:hypothetical protein